MATLEEELAKMNARLKTIQKQMATISAIPKDKLPGYNEPGDTAPQQGNKTDKPKEPQPGATNEMSEEMMAIIKDIRDKLSQIEQARKETNDRIVKQI